MPFLLPLNGKDSSMFGKKMGLNALRQTLLPFRSCFIEVDGHRMHYLEEGQGPAVLLLHGNPTWCFYYREAVKRLQSSFRVIAPDYIGCGFSERTGRKFRAVDRIAHLKDLLRQLKIDKFSLVMHDWGGPIGTGLAVDAPEKVVSLVYLNTTLTETAALPDIIKRAAAPFPGKILTKYTSNFLRLMLNFGVKKSLSPEIQRGYLFPYKNAGQRAAIWDFVADIPFDSAHPTYHDMLEMAEKIQFLQQKPIKIIWGLKDPCFHREMLNKVVQHFPAAEVMEIADASHLVLEDAPDIAIPAINDFLISSSAPLVSEAAMGKVKVREHRMHGGINPLFEAFHQTAGNNPQGLAIIEPKFSRNSVSYQHVSYQSLLNLVNQYQRGLMALGLKPADKVLMLVPPGVDFLALAYAVMARGAIPIFIDPGIGVDNLCRCVADASPDAMIAVPKAQLLRWLKPKFFKGLRFNLAACDWFFGIGPNLSFLKRFSTSAVEPAICDGTVLIAFTSGATGTPKGVVFSDEMIKAQLKIFRDVFGIEPGRKDCPLLPIFSLYSLALGVCSVFPPMDTAKPLALKPEQIVRIIRDLNIDYSFGSPTLWQKIGEYCVLAQEDLRSIKKVLMAGAPVTHKTLQSLKIILPNGMAYTPYGATEALPVTLPDAESVLAAELVPAKGGEQGVYVGMAIPGVQLRIIEQSTQAISDFAQVRVLSPLEIGEVVVSGPNVSRKYLNRPDATKFSKIMDGQHVWHRTGDVGYVDQLNNLYLCGRKMHAVQVAERRYYSLPVERVYNQHPKVRRSALVNINNGQAAGIAVEPLPEHWPHDRVAEEKFRRELLELGRANALTSSIEEVFFFRSFPVDARHNAKIFRDQLSRWVTEKIQQR